MEIKTAAIIMIAAFSDSANVVNQITRGWNKNERATELHEEVEEALEPFKRWQLSWVPREMNRDADKLVDVAHAFRLIAEPHEAADVRALRRQATRSLEARS